MQYEEIKQLIDLFEGTDLVEMELSGEAGSLRLVRSVTGSGKEATPAPEVAPVLPEAPSLSELQDIVATVQNGAREAMGNGSAEIPTVAQEDSGIVVTAPIVGTFYAGSAPEQPPFVKVGDVVAEGDTLCIIEAMKFMNEVPSKAAGTIREILVQDGDFVEFGQPLFRMDAV